MGIQERREREQAQRRQSILDAALVLATQEGWDGVSMRKIANHIEFGAATLYGYFPDKRALLHLLARQGFAALNVELAKSAGKSAERQLLDMISRTWDFAFENRALYELMMSVEIFEFGTAETPSEARQSFLLVVQALGELVGPTRRDLNDLADMFWAATSGLTGLALAGRIAGGPKRARRLLNRLVLDLVASWDAAATK